ncbi:sensor domain-containing diguanylate cyclase [Alkalicoccus halolimnae]|uniref:EAL domain-containing protein n=1 Tax=Alkalicoccus halolimnae TaxID=1667239 RepID=A0A5C7FGU3_9BACI|nr:EAL domain-containing protein [Alkalicoccus halolimnae]TXF85494.1 GGDEF domain-containing protein [Alkalicoccus halolimnae]
MRISSQEMVYYQDFHSYAQKIFHILQDLTTFGTMYVTNISDSSMTVLESFADEGPALEKNMRLSLEDSYCRLIVSSEKPEPLLIEDTVTHPSTSHLALNKKFGIRSYIGAPIILKGEELFGTICMVDSRPEQFNEKDLKQLGNMAELLGMVIELEHNKLHDQRTGVLNREVLQQVDEEKANAVCFHLRVTNFSAVVEGLGSAAAEQALTKFSNRLQQLISDKDLFMSPAPQEFLLYVSNMSHSDSLLDIITRLQDMLRLPVSVKGKETLFTTSAGVSSAPPHGMLPHELFHQACLALEEAQKHGENQITVYEESISERIIRERYLIQELPKALEQEDFYLVFQPQFEAQTQKFTGVETFIRWKHPVLGEIDEETFLPIAEQTGKIYELERWMIAQVCRKLSSEQVRHHFCVSINLSASHSPDVLIPYLRELLWKTKANPFLLMVEFTEPDTQQEIEKLVQLTEEVRALGIQVVLDDFGSGAASLKIIQHLPMDVLKLSASFTAQAAADENSRILLEQLRKLGKVFHFDLAAQGIESRSQWEAMKREKISRVQGSYFSRPVCLEVLKAQLEHDPGFSCAFDRQVQE